MRKLYGAGKFYSRLIMKNIGIFIFIGLLSVVFHEHGWIPDENMYAISQLMYSVVLPALLAYGGGAETGGTQGGILAVCAVTGVLAADTEIGLIGALVLSPAAGFLWKQTEKKMERYVRGDFLMLVRNLSLGVLGGGMAAAGFCLIAPALQFAGAVAGRCVDTMVRNGLLVILAVVIEPAKVFFFNNIVNHAILVPLGASQVQKAGSSVLFLLESNPGPGLGILFALLCTSEKKKNEYAAAILAQAAGGIHEVYFPYVLSNLWLLIPLIVGGMAGNLCFLLLHAGMKSAVSPGSIIILWLMAEKGSRMALLAGIVFSAAVSFLAALTVLKVFPKEKKKNEGEPVLMKKQDMIRKILFVCDGGMGSSAMAAALFRRELAKEGIGGLEVKACAADLVPEDAQILVCQKDFYRNLSPELMRFEIFTVENMTGIQEYGKLMEEICRRNR